ncbi:hypothetical protein OOZ51_14880 [Arthrobacter sp. MI7-26]|uniref:hypothetical protein n=1 Tax=Arthrobacter sp. MI7-26 TaxID=2993653 RepID=UPI002248B14D|nr:hypothetical protein [Arthrobacter sp. MI7-26]MCX2749091.1 hypothetical protein [Arthrobacter sp. MI7-26]
MANQDLDPWDEFDRLTPAGHDRVEGHPGGEPLGFGFQTGVRSASVAFGFAVYALVLGTILVLVGAIDFIGKGELLWLGLMALVEAAFIYGFIQLAHQARNRRSNP